MVRIFQDKVVKMKALFMLLLECSVLQATEVVARVRCCCCLLSAAAAVLLLWVYCSAVLLLRPLIKQPKRVLRVTGPEWNIICLLLLVWTMAYQRRKVAWVATDYYLL